MPPARHRQPEFSDVQNLQIDGQRLWDTLMHTAQFGANIRLVENDRTAFHSVARLEDVPHPHVA